MPRKTWIKINGTWKDCTNLWVKVTGSWVDHALSYIKVSGTWKLCMEYTYQSAAYGDWFTRNDCGVDYEGSSVYFSVGIGYLTSTVSQAAVNQLAIDYVNANGQTYANNNGICTYVPPPEPEEFSVYYTGNTFLGGKTFTLFAEMANFAFDSDIGEVGFDYIRVGTVETYNENTTLVPQSIGFSVTVTFPSAGTWYFTSYAYYQGVKVTGSSGGQDVT